MKNVNLKMQPTIRIDKYHFFIKDLYNWKKQLLRLRVAVSIMNDSIKNLNGRSDNKKVGYEQNIQDTNLSCKMAVLESLNQSPK